MPSSDKTVQDTIARWQTHLLQLDRRNNLLYLKSRSGVRIVDQRPDEIAEALVRTRRGLSFDFVGLRPGRADGSDDAQTEEPEIRGDLRSDLPLADLQRRLGRMRRKDREFEEEQGLNVLFLAIGFLHWIDKDGEQGMAPLLLVPCDLLQQSPRDPFYLSRESDDATDNATLRHALSRMGMSLPDFGDGPPSQYLDTVRQRIRRHGDWSVTDEIYLSTFQFSKIAMWEDLEHMRTGRGRASAGAATCG